MSEGHELEVAVLGYMKDGFDRMEKTYKESTKELRSDFKEQGQTISALQLMQTNLNADFNAAQEVNRVAHKKYESDIKELGAISSKHENIFASFKGGSMSVKWFVSMAMLLVAGFGTIITWLTYLNLIKDI